MMDLSAFTNRLWNREVFPTKHVVVCEDCIQHQARLAVHFQDLFGEGGRSTVQISFVPGGVMAAAVIEHSGAELIILDHDMPFGNGPDLLNWLKATGRSHIPVITFSGIPENNHNLIRHGAHTTFGKEDVINGKADSLIKMLLNL